MNKTLLRISQLAVLSTSLLTFATAGETAFAASPKATPKPTAAAPVLGSACTTAGATATSGGKSLLCAKALSGKLVWTLASVAGAGSAGGPGAMGGPNANPTMAAALAKYTACLKAQGVTLPAFGGRRGFGGTRSGAPSQGATPAPRPTLSAKQQAAMTKCASLRPAFGGGGAGRTGGFGPNGGFGGGVANTPANVAAYISCLNSNGVNVGALSDIAGLDMQSPKVSAALKACRAKRVSMAPNAGATPKP
jgi:hypothetical protein